MDLPIAPGTVASGSGDRPPGSGTPGEFSSGNPLASPAVLPTEITAAALNAIVLEIRNAIVASGQTPSNAVLTQLASAIALAPGRVVKTTAYSGSGFSAAFTPNAQTKTARVWMGGAGGSGGSTDSTATGQVAIAGSGGSGAFAYALWNTPSAQTITLGTGGIPASGTPDGTASTIGSLTVPGGYGGAHGSPTSPQFISTPGLGGGLPTIGTPSEFTFLLQSTGTSGSPGIALSASLVMQGAGGTHPGGIAGGPATTGGATAQNGGPGSGASGASSVQAQGARAGANGGGGWIVIVEYS